MPSLEAETNDISDHVTVSVRQAQKNLGTLMNQNSDMT